MIKRTFALAGALCLVLCLSPASLGCTCHPMDVAEAFARADVVFVGKVVKTAPVKEASVGMVVNSGPMKNWPWRKDVIETHAVTLEVGEAFKGTAGDAVEITAGVVGAGSCGSEFEVGESYLVYAYKRRRFLGADAAKLPKESWTEETRLNAEADELNAKLPPLQTSVCTRTGRLGGRAEDLSEIRRMVKQ